MPFPVALISTAVSAVKTLVRLRGRIDSIICVKTAADPLPFALPPLPEIMEYGDVDAMIAYFKQEGASVLLAAGKLDEFVKYQTLGQADRTPARTDPLLRLYYQTGKCAAGGAFSDPAQTVIEYYLVESCRLTNNPAYLRVILAAADTLMEFAGDNASLFISNPKTANILGMLFREFAGREDFDDQGLDRIFKKLLGTAVITALQSKDDLPDHPALLVLYAALGEVRSKMGDDFVAKIISTEGFASITSTYLTLAAQDPGFSTIVQGAVGLDPTKDPQWPILRGAFAATLTTLGDNFELAFRDPAVLKSVLEAAVSAASANAAPLIGTLADKRPMLAAVLQEVATAVSRRKDLFDSLGNGELIGEIYRASLASVARDPDLDGNGVKSLVERIAGSLADELSQDTLRRTIQELKQRKGPVYVNRLLARAVGVVGNAPELLEGDASYFRAVLAGILQSGAPLLRDGLQPDDLLAILTTAIDRGLADPSLMDIPDPVRALLVDFGQALAEGNLHARFGTPENRKEALLAVVHSAAAGSSLWRVLHDRALLPAVIAAISGGLSADKARVLTGGRLVEALKVILRALHERGLNLIGKDQGPADEAEKSRLRILLQGLISDTISALAEDIGRRLSIDDAPTYLYRVLSLALVRGIDGPEILKSTIDNVRARFDEAA